MKVKEFQKIIREYADKLDEKREDANVLVYVPAMQEYLPFRHVGDLDIYFVFRLPEDDEE